MIHPELDFDVLDGTLALAAGASTTELFTFVPGPLGPMVELTWLRTQCASLPSVDELRPSIRSRTFMQGMRSGQLSKAIRQNQHVAFIRTLWNPQQGDDKQFHEFCSFAQEGSERAGINRQVAQELIGAILELEDNIHLHSEKPRTGLVGFSAVPGRVEFVVADEGIGVLRSLRTSPENHSIVDHGTALIAAIREHKSRFGSGVGHGTGFRQLFIGLYNLRSLLRFRTGDYVLMMDGRDLDKTKGQLIQCREIPGFVTSIICQPV